MLRFLARRLVLTIPVLLGVATLVFSLIHFIPGDPALAMLGETASPEDVAELRTRLGLDRPLVEQYRQLPRRRAPGRSRDVAADQPAGEPGDPRAAAGDHRAGRRGDDRRDLISIPLGIAAAVWRGTSIDHGAMTLALLGISIPNFWLGPLLAIVFAVELGWLPVSGRGTSAT